MVPGCATLFLAHSLAAPNNGPPVSPLIRSRILALLPALACCTSVRKPLAVSMQNIKRYLSIRSKKMTGHARGCIIMRRMWLLATAWIMFNMWLPEQNATSTGLVACVRGMQRRDAEKSAQEMLRPGLPRETAMLVLAQAS